MSPLPRPEQFQSTAVQFDEVALSDTEEPFEDHGHHGRRSHESTFDHIVDGIARRLSVEAAAGAANLYRPRTESNTSRPGSFSSIHSHRRSRSSQHRGSRQSCQSPHDQSSQQNRVRWHSHVHDRSSERPRPGDQLAVSEDQGGHLPRIDSEKTLARSDSDLSSKGSLAERKGSSDVVGNVDCLPRPPVSDDLESYVSTLYSDAGIPELSKTRKIILGIVVMFCLFISVS